MHTIIVRWEILKMPGRLNLRRICYFRGNVWNISHVLPSANREIHWRNQEWTCQSKMSICLSYMNRDGCTPNLGKLIVNSLPYMTQEDRLAASHLRSCLKTASTALVTQILHRSILRKTQPLLKVIICAVLASVIMMASVCIPWCSFQSL